MLFFSILHKAAEYILSLPPFFLFHNSLRADILLRLLNSIMMSSICYFLLSLGQKQIKSQIRSLRLNSSEVIVPLAPCATKPIQIKKLSTIYIYEPIYFALLPNNTIMSI